MNDRTENLKETREAALQNFIDAAGYSWRVDEEHLPVVRDEIAPNLARLDSYPQATVLKKSTTRAVFRFLPRENGSRALVVKRHESRQFSDALKYSVMASRARAEWTILGRLRARGIACPKPIALAEKRRFGMFQGACLIIEAVEHVDLLPEAVSSGLDKPGRRGLLERVGALVRSIHDNGFDHHDMHCGNFLILEDADGDRVPFPIDFHAVRIRSVVSPARRAAGIAKLCFSLMGIITRHDHLRLLRSYFDSGGGLPGGWDFRSFFFRVNRIAEGMRRTRVLSRSKRCMLNSSRFARERKDGMHLFRQRVFSVDDAMKAVALHRRTLDSGGAGVFKNFPKTAVTRVTIPGVGRRLCVKEFKRRGLLVGLLRRFFGSKARKAWRSANGLLVRGIRTPDPLACVELLKAGLVLQESYLITEFCEEACPLDHYFRESGKREFLLANDQARRRLVGGVADLLSRLHTLDVHHRDLAPKNWLVRRLNGDWDLTLVDMDEVDLNHRLNLREKLHCLVQLYDQPEVLSAADRLRFLAAYASRHPQVRASEHRLGIRREARNRWERHCSLLGLSPDEPEPL